VKGVAGLTAGEFTKKAGPVIPIECEAPFAVPLDDQRNTDFCKNGPECKNNPECARLGLSGICCRPNSEDTNLPW
jgi:hypothetical protein